MEEIKNLLEDQKEKNFNAYSLFYPTSIFKYTLGNK
jgi:hypothetical protein